ncbi:hypothetical protein H0Z60_04950 [Ectothiorhodospiraceae bacterium WFHF3C12]|nr:hypothetical protein [Ectothiorhodospiraceae bacterium WFHF3C12]
MSAPKAHTIASVTQAQEKHSIEALTRELQELHSAGYGLYAIGIILGEDEIPGNVRGGLGDAVKLLGDLVQRRAIEYLDEFGLDPYSPHSDLSEAARRHSEGSR